MTDIARNRQAGVLVSYCSTCMNRLWQLKQTLPFNLDVIERYEGLVELCLVNFIKDGEGEEIDRWVKSLGRRVGFKYYVASDLKSWHASMAKNTAHLQGDGKLLVNLDCDNFIASEVVDRLLVLVQKVPAKILFSGFTGAFREEKTKNKRFLKRQLLLARCLFDQIVKKDTIFKVKRQPVLLRSQRINADRDFNGTYGHIGLSRDLFLAVGGYDQQLPPMGGQDKDLLWRAYNVEGVHFTHIAQPGNLLPVHNEKKESLKNTDVAAGDWAEIERSGTAKALFAVRNRLLIANRAELIGVPVELVV